MTIFAMHVIQVALVVQAHIFINALHVNLDTIKVVLLAYNVIALARLV
jgi:hypothetical protein